MSDETDKIDETAFIQGREAFDRNVSLRTVVTMVRTSADTVADENRVFSFALGFADALVDRMRASRAAVPNVVIHRDGTVSPVEIVDKIDGVVRAWRPGDVFRKTVA